MTSHSAESALCEHPRGFVVASECPDCGETDPIVLRMVAESVCRHPELENKNLAQPLWDCLICGEKVDDGGGPR